MTMKKYEPTDEGLWYFVNERHRIYLAKEAGKPPPWTKDPVLQQYKFTNVFRQLDRVTKEYTRLVNTPFFRKRPVLLIFNTILFRFFNWPPTYSSFETNGLTAHWDEDAARELLKARRDLGHQIFTGAYIVTNGASPRPKIDLYCEAASWAWRHRESIADRIEGGTLQNAAHVLSEIPLVGPFIGYEMVSDLRWSVLSHAPDINTWANVGPGALRGLNRYYGWPIGSREDRRARKAAGLQSRPKYKFNHKTGLDEIVRLLAESPEHLEDHVPELELREIEHSLCEYDKMMRVRLGEGRPRSKYPGMGV